MGAARHRRTKAEWRRGVRERRRRLDPDDVARDGVLLAALVRGLPEARAADVVAAYVSRTAEPSSTALLRAWRTDDRTEATGRADPRTDPRTGPRTVLLPVVRPDLDLDWAVDDATRAPGAVVDVDEPAGRRLGPEAVSRAQLVVVPALAVDRTGTRLGQGGGSYDRALARLAPGALVVALLHDGELVDEPLPAEPHDQPVHVVVTPSGVVRLTAGRAAAPARPRPPSAPRPG